jgi:RimJ/RimL family protein N-acetyltransferase
LEFRYYATGKEKHWRRFLGKEIIHRSLEFCFFGGAGGEQDGNLGSLEARTLAQNLLSNLNIECDNLDYHRFVSLTQYEN